VRSSVVRFLEFAGQPRALQLRGRASKFPGAPSDPAQLAKLGFAWPSHFLYTNPYHLDFSTERKYPASPRRQLEGDEILE
jgi:hypothetical protein